MACRHGHAFALHLLAPRPRCLRPVEARRRHRGESKRPGCRRRKGAVATSTWLGEHVAAHDRLVARVGGGCETALVTRVRVDREIQLQHLGDRARLELVRLLRVEVQQKAAQALAASALGRDVIVHPRASVAHRRECPASLSPLVVVEADNVGTLTPLTHTRPRGAFRPRPSHNATSSAAPSTWAANACAHTLDQTSQSVSFLSTRGVRAEVVPLRERHPRTGTPNTNRLRARVRTLACSSLCGRLTEIGLYILRVRRL